MKIDLREFNRWIAERFKGKDLITFEELISDYEDLILENEHLKEEQEDQMELLQLQELNKMNMKFTEICN